MVLETCEEAQDKKVAPAAGSEKDPQAGTDTKAKRTFFEVVLGDDPVLGKKKEQNLLEKQKVEDMRTTMLQKLLETMGEDDTIKDLRDAVKHDLEKGTKLQPRRSQTLLESRRKLRSLSERKTGSVSWKVTRKKLNWFSKTDWNRWKANELCSQT